MDDSTRSILTSGALRSRTVARLAGFAPRTLRDWHQTGLIQAHVAPGGPGHPRLYSWVDYMRLRAAGKLLSEGVRTREIRPAIADLDREFPDWYLLPLHGF